MMENCLYYAIILSAWYQNKDDNDNGTREIMNEKFGKACVNKFIDENFELIQLKKERREASVEKDAELAQRVKEIEDNTDDCINTFKNGFIEWYVKDPTKAIGDETLFRPAFDIEIDRVKRSIANKMENFAEAFLSKMLARYLGINIRILSPLIKRGETKQSGWVENLYESGTPAESQTTTIIFDVTQEHFDGTTIQN